MGQPSAPTGIQMVLAMAVGIGLGLVGGYFVDRPSQAEQEAVAALKACEAKAAQVYSELTRHIQAKAEDIERRDAKISALEADRINRAQLIEKLEAEVKRLSAGK